MTKKPRFHSHTPINLDFVDRVFNYLGREYPELIGARMDELKAAVRTEFYGEIGYVSARSSLDRHRQAQKVLALFNGRNAREVARELGISRATVYRALKQPGGVSVSALHGNETAKPVGSIRTGVRAAETEHGLTDGIHAKRP